MSLGTREVWLERVQSMCRDLRACFSGVSVAHIIPNQSRGGRAVGRALPEAL